MSLKTELVKKVMPVMLALSVSGGLFISTMEDGAKGPALEAYADPVKIPTICTGHTKGVTLGMKVTPAQCEVWLKEDTGIAAEAVSRQVKVPITQGQYDSLVSFTYNCGSGNLKGIARLINAGDSCSAGKLLIRYHHAKGKSLPGLVRRRNLEAIPFLEECNNARYRPVGAVRPS